MDSLVIDIGHIRKNTYQINIRKTLFFEDKTMKPPDRSINTPALAVIILNWNGWNDTCECLASLKQSTYQDFQIILIDNGSTDDSIEKIKSWANGELPVSVGPFEKKPETPSQ